MVKSKCPDIVTMDIRMPKMDGYEATRKMMATNPVPIVMVSATLSLEGVESSCKAMEAGAIAALEKPKGPGHPEADRMVKKLARTLRIMSEIKVVRRTAKQSIPGTASRLSAVTATRPGTVRAELVAIGASTGGLPAIKTILSGLPENFPVPILIVQHITSGFLPGMVKWLDAEIALPVKIAAHRDRILKRHVYFAPNDHHVGINQKGKIVLSDTPPINGVRPSVSHLFSSVARSYGQRAIGVLLTGMGKDGALGLKEMKEKGALTIAQDKESSVVFGMPAEAIKMNAADKIFSPKEIACFLGSLDF